VARRRQVALLELPQDGAREARLLVGAEAELDRDVAVALARPHFGHGARAGLDDGHGDAVALLPEDLGHAHLLADQSHHVRVFLSEAHGDPDPPAADPPPSLRP
jgi:hypothetical protein